MASYTKPDVVYLVEHVRNGVPKYWVYGRQENAYTHVLQLLADIKEHGGDVSCKYIPVSEMRDVKLED